MTNVSDETLRVAAFAATRAASSGHYHPDLVDTALQIGAPLVVKDINLSPQYIVVPSLHQSSIFGYFTCNRSGQVTEFASFCATLTDIATCPLAAVWLDPKLVVQTASENFPTLKNIQDVFLSFDGYPDKLVWRVVGQDNNDRALTILVAGLYAYKAP